MVGRGWRRPLPLGLYGITLGLAGLGGAWVAMVQLDDVPRWPSEVFYGAASVLWIAFTVLYIVGGAHRPGVLRADMRHPGSGPFTAFIPAVAILLTSHYAQYFAVLGRWVTVGFVALLAVLAARLVAHWLAGGLGADALHGGYFIPVVAGPFIASIGLTSVGLHEFAFICFGAGIFFWLTIGTLVMGRHISGGTAPASIAPALSAFLAAPSSASVAWLISHPGPMGDVQFALTGVVFVMILVQLWLVAEYRRLAFGLHFWVFTFPVATTANYLVRWLSASDFPHWVVGAWIVIAIATGVVLAIAAASVVSLARARATTRIERSRTGAVL